MPVAAPSANRLGHMATLSELHLHSGSSKFCFSVCRVLVATRMAKVLLAATFSLTLVRTCLVLDAVCSHGGMVGRAAQSTRRMLHFHPVSHRPLSSRPISMGRGGGAPKTRFGGRGDRLYAVTRFATCWRCHSPPVHAHACACLCRHLDQQHKVINCFFVF